MRPLVRARRAAILAALALPAALALKAAAGSAGAGPGPVADQTRPSLPIILATTTSTHDSGLLDALIPPFEARSGLDVKVIPVGSGQALALAERGEADLVLSHAPESEERFMAAGAGILRRRLMYNDFILVGPSADPAGVRGMSEAPAALASIARSGSLFVSRSDESGTHQLERKLWTAAGLSPAFGDPFYMETGQGMAATLRVASEKRGYTLSDRGTFLSQKGGLDLEVVLEGDPVLRNVYHLIVVNPANGPRVNVEGARALTRYLLSPDALRIVRDFGRERHGQPLFVPDAEPYGGSEPAAGRASVRW